MSHWQGFLVHAAHDRSKAGAIAMIVTGFFLAPMLVGIPIMLFGIYRLFK